MKKFIFILMIILTFTLSGCSLLLPQDTRNDTNEEVQTVLTEEEIIDLIEELMPEAEQKTSVTIDNFQDQIVTMIAQARKGVIGIVANSDFGQSTGSGVIYKNEGNQHYVVTNHHVVDGASEFFIVYEKDGLLYEVADEFITLVGSHPVTDLAVLTFNSTDDFNVVPLADSYEVQLGEFVYAIGNPLGFDYYGTVTMGVISGLARYVSDGEFNATLLQHDAAISPGNSGGALLNINGELVGINNLKLVQDDVTSIGFAIPSNTVKRITEDLEDDGRVTRPYLGINTIAQVNLCNDGPGVCVSVQEGGTADEAGLQDGDTVIGYKTADMEDFIVINNFNDLKEAILSSKVDDFITIKYIRDGQEEISNEAKLDVHPDDVY